jgi:hypothetical protein
MLYYSVSAVCVKDMIEVINLMSDGRVMRAQECKQELLVNTG